MDTKTRGGSDSFMRRFMDFEPTDDAVVDVPAPALAAVPDPAEPAAEPTLPAAPGFTLPPHLADPAAFASTVRDTMIQLAQESAPPVDPYANLPEFDAYDPESFRAHIAAGVRAEQKALEEKLSQLTGLVEPLARREGRAQAVEALTQIEGEIGKFDHDDAAMRATLLIGQGVGRDDAVRIAAQQSRSRDEQLRVQAVKDYVASLSTITDPANVLPGSTAVPGATPVVEIPAGKKGYETLVERHLAGVGAGVPTG